MNDCYKNKNIFLNVIQFILVKKFIIFLKLMDDTFVKVISIYDRLNTLKLFSFRLNDFELELAMDNLDKISSLT